MNYSFWDFHVAIQDAMGWTDSHLHEFIIKFPGGILKISIGISDEDGFEGEKIQVALITDYYCIYAVCDTTI